LNIGAVKRLKFGLKRFFTFRQGRVAARRYAREQQRLRNKLESGLEKRLTSSLNKSARIVSQGLRQGYEPELGVITVPLRNELEAVFSAHVKRVFSAVYDYNNSKYKNLDTKADGDASFGVGFGNSAEFDSLIQQYLQSRKSYITNMSQGYGRAIIGDVVRLREEGFNLRQVSTQIRSKFSAISKTRAATIARTETHSATSAAQDSYHRKVSDSYGVTMKKQWVSTSDARTRRNHSAMNGAIVEMDEDFLMPDGARMKHTGDPRGGAANVVNCRCVILYVDSEDEIEDEAVPEKAEDAQENAEGVRVDSKGRPVGLTQDEFDKIHEGQDMGKLGKLSHSQMGKRFRDSMDGTWSQEGWLPFKAESLYRGRKASQYGKISSGLKPTAKSTPAFNTGIAQLREIHMEIDQLADSFGIPRTRGFIASRGNSIANMGDGVMGWNKKWVTHFGMRKKEFASAWKKGDAARDRPFNAISYFEDRMDQMRTVAYHEFGHQVHQLYALNKGRGTYRMPSVESRIRGQRVTGGPSRYSQSNPKEWFAENFAMWAMRREDLVDSDFIELIEDLLEGASG
jgi:hypothetical protein